MKPEHQGLRCLCFVGFNKELTKFQFSIIHLFQYQLDDAVNCITFTWDLTKSMACILGPEEHKSHTLSTDILACPIAV